MGKAFISALNSLTRREHSVLELKQKLERKGFSEQEIVEAINECQRLGYQSDDRFAEHLSRARIVQGYGPVRIKQELTSKGIHEEQIDQVLQQEADESWLVRALQVANKKSQPFKVNHSIAKSLSWDEQQKLKRFLLYRGFPGHIIAGLFEKC